MDEKLPALTVRGVRKTFEAENAPVRALRGVDLTVDGGRVRRPDGTVGLRQVDAAEPGGRAGDSPTRARITVADEEVTGRGEDDLARLRRKHIGIIFQFFNLLEGMTVLENVALPAVIAGRKRRMAETRARDLLDLLGIGDKAAAAARRAVRRPAAAAGDRAGAGQRADPAAGRRAHRRPRLRRRPGGHRAAEPAARRRPDHRPGHPRLPGGRRRPSASCACSTGAFCAADGGASRGTARVSPARPANREPVRAAHLAWYRFRVTFRRRVGGYLTLAVLLGLLGGVAMAALIAARRTESSYPTSWPAPTRRA